MIYHTLNLIVAPKNLAQKTVSEFLTVPDGSSVLDLGCGYGPKARFFVGRTRYVGVDSNAKYIDVARKRYPNSGAEFVVGDIADPKVLAMGPFDLVFLAGVLHHLNSDEVTALARASKNIVTKTGSFVAIEPVFDSSQGLLARLIIAADRGRYVRDKDGYVFLLQNGFSHVDTQIQHGRLRIPYSHVILTCRNQ